MDARAMSESFTITAMPLYTKSYRHDRRSAPHAADRLAAWRANHEAYARVHGEAAHAAQEKFYAVIDSLHRSGSLGGVRLIARAP